MCAVQLKYEYKIDQRHLNKNPRQKYNVVSQDVTLKGQNAQAYLVFLIIGATLPIRQAYSATSLPPLGKSNHNLVFLQPTYKPCVRKLPVTTRTFRKWTLEGSKSLKDCFECTEWNVLLEAEENSSDMDINGMVGRVTDYINFCWDIVIPGRTVRCFANNKPWITGDIKALLNQKKQAFKEGDWDKIRCVQHELKKSLRQAKLDYKSKVERKLQHQKGVERHEEYDWP